MTEQANLHQKIIAKCWADDAFKQSLMADPAGTLKQEGVEVPAGVNVRVVENTATAAYWVIPARPAALADDDLEGASGGQCGQVGKWGIDVS